ncbi:DUF302 domain-containing protein [Cupriavidus sp. IDO]|uniref:DUF302 domain-containing protein n=1 Tax=Cupriavidus sp. IDO TaxID=1539142 RepID=UPI000690AE81|nr:DUF302 domain-containing protein [Cupriavidus sp. IDO]KWR74611.1 hypothetical protein RM96_35415 [Cupriavidus sp. IDO]
MTGQLDKGMTFFARIDHAEAARNAGLAMPPMQLLIYGNVKRGTPLMLAATSAVLDLPLRVLVRDDCQGCARVSFHAAELESAHPLPAGSAAPLAVAQRLIPDTVGAQGAPG